MNEAEMQHLAAHLTRSGRILGFNERAFDGLPGAVVLGVTGMRDTVYPSLGPQAKLVLRTIKLLRSAGIQEYTLQRVIVVGADAFHLEPNQIMTAIDALRHVAFLTMGSPTSAGQPTIIPSTDYFFDIAVPDYPSLADAIVDWPLLRESLKRINDGAALARLGDAFREQADYTNAEICYQAALPSFKRSTSPLERASVEYGLGLVLVQRAAESQEPERKELLEQAQDYFTGVLGVVNQQNNPAIWVGAMEGWRDVLRREPQTTHTPSRVQSIEKALEEARRSASNTLRSSVAWAEAQLNVGVLELLEARLEQNARLR
jgi:tetratricopeptide (TPR) repeat protein